MKLLVALAMAVHVSSSATDGPGSTIQLPREKPDPNPEVPDCAPVYDCAELSSVCLVFDKDLCEVKNGHDYLTEQTCLDLFDPESGFADGNVKWCPEQCAPPADEWDCGEFSKTCKVFDKSQCKVKNKGFETQAGCSTSNYDPDQIGNLVLWCAEKPLEKQAVGKCKGNKCILRKESNGKIIIRNQGSPACEGAEDVFNCPDYDSLLDCAINGDCTEVIQG